MASEGATHLIARVGRVGADFRAVGVAFGVGDDEGRVQVFLPAVRQKQGHVDNPSVPSPRLGKSSRGCPLAIHATRAGKVAERAQNGTP